jgi:hypothetical protein
MEAQEKQSRFNGQRPDPEGRCTSILYGFHLGKPNAATDVSGESVREDIEKLIHDLKYTVRSLRRSKIFAAAVAVRLSACIAVNVAIFAIVNSVLLRPLPVPNSAEIVLMSNRYPKAGVGEQFISSSGDYYDRREKVTALDEQAEFRFVNETIEINGTAQRVRAMMATPSLFSVLKVAPLRSGRSRK